MVFRVNRVLGDTIDQVRRAEEPFQRVSSYQAQQKASSTARSRQAAIKNNATRQDGGQRLRGILQL
jgi:hypothetical protein